MSCKKTVIRSKPNTTLLSNKCVKCILHVFFRAQIYAPKAAYRKTAAVKSHPTHAGPGENVEARAIFLDGIISRFVSALPMSNTLHVLSW